MDGCYTGVIAETMVSKKEINEKGFLTQVFQYLCYQG